MTGRSDKKFCSINCKNHYHKKLRAFNKDVITKTDEILHRNYIILVELTRHKKIKRIQVPRINLEKAGFKFNYHTGTYKNNNDKIYHFIYDLAWMEFSTQEIMVIHKNQK